MRLLLHLLKPRQAPPPSGEIFTGDVHANEVRIIATSAFTIFLATASVALRFIARKKRDLSWKADDYWMLVAAVGFLFALTVQCPDRSKSCSSV